MPRSHVNGRRRTRGAKGKDGKNERRADGGREKKRPSAERDESLKGQTPARTLSRELRRLLEGIGTPAPAPFKPDPFQTGSARRARKRRRAGDGADGQRQDLDRARGDSSSPRRREARVVHEPSQGADQLEVSGVRGRVRRGKVGILTGDRKENADAPLIVGTTEIYRNQLFDALRGGSNIRADLVVLDEAHYLADEERGHVWEEAIILSPPRVRLLLLSATVGNAEEFADWMAEVRGVRCGVVPRPGARPVPLRAAFLLPDGAACCRSSTNRQASIRRSRASCRHENAGARHVPHVLIGDPAERQAARVETEHARDAALDSFSRRSALTICCPPSSFCRRAGAATRRRRKPRSRGATNA